MPTLVFSSAFLHSFRSSSISRWKGNKRFFMQFKHLTTHCWPPTFYFFMCRCTQQCVHFVLHYITLVARSKKYIFALSVLLPFQFTVLLHRLLFQNIISPTFTVKGCSANKSCRCNVHLFTNNMALFVFYYLEIHNTFYLLCLDGRKSEVNLFTFRGVNMNGNHKKSYRKDYCFSPIIQSNEQTIGKKSDLH